MSEYYFFWFIWVFFGFFYGFGGFFKELLGFVKVSLKICFSFVYKVMCLFVVGVFGEFFLLLGFFFGGCEVFF